MYNKNYYDFALNDYQLIKYLVENNQIYNIICPLCVETSVKFLKFIIVKYIKENDYNFEDYYNILITNNFNSICNFINKYLYDFKFDKNEICKINHFNFVTKYPWKNNYIPNKDDINLCWESLNYTKNIVDEYLNNNNNKNNK